MGKSVGTHTVLVFKGVAFGGKWFRVFPPGPVQPGGNDAADQTSGKATTMTVPAVGVLYQSDGAATLEVVTQDPQGVDRSFPFTFNTSVAVYIEDDVIHVPATLQLRAGQPFNP